MEVGKIKELRKFLYYCSRCRKVLCSADEVRNHLHGYYKPHRAGKLVEWAEWSWNPVVGCYTGCRYCYARNRIAPRLNCPLCRKFIPHLHAERLNVTSPGPGLIFACDLSDPYGWWVHRDAIRLIHEAIAKLPNLVLALTKWPQRLPGLEFPNNLAVGVTVTRQEDTYRIDWLRKCSARLKVVSFEPLLMPISADLTDIDWVIIGGMTGKGGRVIKAPKRGWIDDIIAEARKVDAKVFVKDNALYPTKLKEKFSTLREFQSPITSFFKEKSLNM